VDECKPLPPGGLDFVEEPPTRVVTPAFSASSLSGTCISCISGVENKFDAGPGGATVEQGLTLVPISAQLEITLPLSAQLKLIVSPI